jgi:DNA polymerase elongation subunit (family B)
MLFLWNVSFTDTNREIKLEFYDSSSKEIKSFATNQYNPYFLASYPLSKDEENALASVQGDVELVKKRDIFTDEVVQLAKVKAWTPTFLKKLQGQFKDVWESEIEYGRSYIYDNDLVFGTAYTQQGSNFVAVKDTPQGLRQQFNKAFAQEKKIAPQKYAQIKEWFNLCHQPVPDIDLDLLGSKERHENATEQIYLAFLLARIANIPVPEAYTSRRVSDWIKSMIYTYLRKNNILIPTSTKNPQSRGCPHNRTRSWNILQHSCLRLRKPLSKLHRQLQPLL